MARLNEIRNRFSPADREEKLHLLAELNRRPLRRPALLLAYHQALCFLQVYPDDGRVLAAVEEALAGFADRVRRLERENPQTLAELHDSGIIGTRISYPHTWPIAREFIGRFPHHARIDRDGYEDTDKLDELLRLLVTQVESDALDDTQADPWDFLDLLSRTAGLTDLHWLIGRLEQAPWPEAVRARLYDMLGLWVDWKLDQQSASHTLAKDQAATVAYQRRPLRRETKDIARAIARPTPPPELLHEKDAARLIERARLTSCLRRREVYGHTYGNPAEVYLARAAGGLQIAFIGALPDYRFPVESTYATAISKNGVPIGYGYHTILFDRVETGINIYDSFRGAEAAYIFERMLAGLHHLFGVTRFVVHRYQIGDQNQEALESGSYWFYYKMGFRPLEKDVAELTRRELDRISRQPGYRSNRPTLKRLARTEMYLGLAGRGPDSYRELRPGLLALRVSAHIQRAFAGDRAAAEKSSAANLAKTLSLRRSELRPGPQRRWYEQLSLLVSLIPDLEDWPPADKTALGELLPAKGAPQEIEYVRRMQQHTRLRQAYERLAGGG